MSPGGADAASAPGPDAVVPALDATQIRALRELGRRWDGPASQLETTSAENEAATGAKRIRRLLLGRPLTSTALASERMGKTVALPVLSADALSSVAYGPEAMLAVLVLGGGAALTWSLPIAGAIAFLMLAVGLSYRQTIKAYPHGGGSYIVATENLGRLAGLVAAGGLVTDYVLTVAVSVSAGIDAIASAIPAARPDAVVIGLGVVAILLAGNLRGVRQAGALFSLPTYAFIVAILALVAVGLWQSAGRGFHAVPPPALGTSHSLGLLLVLRAFASGSTAMTGIEAISNAVPVFRPVEWRNARIALSWMIALLIAMFAGVAFLVHLDGIVPMTGQTVLSQLAHRSFGDGPLYVYTQAATALVLLLAANTAYNDFPRVMFLLARDGQAPMAFLRMGDRLAFNVGIAALSLTAAVMLAGFGGQTASLIPLYAVGVFAAFTLSQAGMVVHWWRRREDHWRKSMAFNAMGCGMSAIVFVIAAVTKFAQGAWVALAVVVVFTCVALRVRRHYDRTHQALALEDGGIRAEAEERPDEVRNLAIVALATLNREGMRALAYATSLGQPVVALHISPTAQEAERFRGYWQTWGAHVPLEVIESPYRAIVAPIVAYVESLHRRRPDLTLTVVVPELVVRHWWQRPLHDQTAARLRRALRPLPKIVVASVPFHLAS